MAEVRTLLNNIKNAIYGKDVRKSIHDAIEQCYYDGKAGGNDLEARDRAAAAEARMDTFTALKNGSTTGDAELVDIRIGINGQKYANAGTAVREQIRDTHTIEVTDVEPTRDNTQLWINPEERDVFYIPEVKDDEVSDVDTWSSKQITRRIGYTNNGIKNTIHLFSDAPGIKTTDCLPVATVEIGKLISSTGQIIDYSSDSYKVASFTVDSCEIYYITCNASWGNLVYCFYDENDRTVDYIVSENSEVLTSIKDFVVVPAGATKLTISTTDNTLSLYKVDQIKTNLGIENLVNILKNSDGLATTECVTDDVVITGMLLQNSGTLRAYSNDSYKVGVFDVKPYDLYYVHCNAHYGNLAYAFYNDRDEVVDSYVSGTGSDVVVVNKLLVSPSTAVKLIIATVDGSLSLKKVEKLEYASKYPWSNLKWVCIGDSLTEVNSRTNLHYHDYIAEKTGISVENMGVSGTGFKQLENDNKAYYQRILNVPTDVDVVTIMASGNDVSLDLGDPSDTDTNTLCGCINKTIDELYSILPTVQLGIITSPPWKAYPPNIENGMQKYTDAIIDICNRRGIPCLDLYRCSGLRPWDATFRDLAYSKDDDGGVHPDEIGHKMIASQIKTFLDRLVGCL